MVRSLRSTGARGGFTALVVSAALVASAVSAGARVAPRPQGVLPATGVPKGFRANSITFKSPLLGWVLGNAPCGQSTCTDVIGTTDGGTSWHPLGTIAAPIARISGQGTVPGVDEIRFSTAKIGFAFGPFLFRSTDGGRTWSKMTIPGGAKQAIDLAGNAAGTYLLTSTCTYGGGICNQKPLDLWRSGARPGERSWSQISLTLPANTAGEDGGAHVTVLRRLPGACCSSGTAVYVVDPQAPGTDKFFASTDGFHFATRSVPCAKLNDSHLFRAIPTSATDVALLCVGNPSMGMSDKVVFRSTDTGEHDENAGIMNKFGYPASLAASPSGNLASESESGGSFIDINDSKTGTTWIREVNRGDGGVGWNDIVYVANRVAWIVYAPVQGANPDNVGELYVTKDAGHTWTRVRP